MSQVIGGNCKSQTAAPGERPFRGTIALGSTVRDDSLDVTVSDDDIAVLLKRFFLNQRFGRCL